MIRYRLKMPPTDSQNPRHPRLSGRLLPVGLRQMKFGAALLSLGFLLSTASLAEAATFKLNNGETVEGEVVHVTRNTLMVRLSTGGGLQQLSRGAVEVVQITTSSGEEVSGSLESWRDGVYEIESDDRLIQVTNKKILSAGELKPPILTISEAKDSENAPELVFDIGLSRPSKKPVLVIFATIDRTAKSGEDFQEARGSITLTPGNTAAAVKVPLINDTLAEEDEYFEVFVATDKNVAVIKTKRAIGTIINDDEETEPPENGDSGHVDSETSDIQEGEELSLKDEE